MHHICIHIFFQTVLTLNCTQVGWQSIKFTNIIQWMIKLLIKFHTNSRLHTSLNSRLIPGFSRLLDYLTTKRLDRKALHLVEAMCFPVSKLCAGCARLATTEARQSTASRSEGRLIIIPGTSWQFGYRDGLARHLRRSAI